MNLKLADNILIVQTILLGLACVYLNTAAVPDYPGTLQRILMTIASISATSAQFRGAPILWVMLVLCIVALAQYLGPHRKRGLLRFVCAVGFLKAFFISAIIIKSMLEMNRLAWAESRTGLLIFVTLWYLAWLISSMLALRYHARREKHLLSAAALHRQPENTGQDGVLSETDLAGPASLLSATNDRRLGNYIIDTLLIFFVVTPHLGILLNEYRVFILDEHRDTTAFYVVTAAGIVVYYSLMEGLFASTPGKFVTGTRLIHENGQPAGALRILGRSLCRLIPFDALSFLGNRGWHDSISKTDVVELKGPA